MEFTPCLEKSTLVTQPSLTSRTLEVKTADNQKFEATLTTANAQDIVLNWKAREPKPIGKGKVTVQKTATLLYSDINEAKVKILF